MFYKLKHLRKLNLSLVFIMMFCLLFNCFGGIAMADTDNEIAFKAGNSGYTVTLKGVDTSVSMVNLPEGYADAITAVKVDGTPLSSDQWSLTTSGTDNENGTLTFIRTDTKPIFQLANGEQSKEYTITVEATGYDTVKQKYTFINYGANSFTVRQLDSKGNIVKSKTYTMDELKNMGKTKTAQKYQTYCNMAGLRTFVADGVLLTDILDKASIEYGEGCTFKLRTNDCTTKGTNDPADSLNDNAYYRMGTFTYESLLGQTRYYFPAVFTDSELNAYLAKSDTSFAGTSEKSLETRTKLGSSSGKVTVTPLIAWNYDEHVMKSENTEPTVDDYSDLISKERSFRFLYGIPMEAENRTGNEQATFSATYCAFGMDVIQPATIGYEAWTDHDGEVVYGVDDQKFHIKVNFDQNVTIKDAAALLDEMNITINGSGVFKSTQAANGRYGEVIQGSDKNSVEFILHLGTAPPITGRVVITADSTLVNLVGENNNGIVWKKIEFLMNNGVKMETVKQVAADGDAVKASVTKKVIAPTDCTRGMVHLVLLKNGKPVGTVNANNGNIVAHYHDYLNLDAAGFAKLIPGWCSSFKDDYDFTVNGDQITVTAKQSSEGDVLDLRVVAYPQDRDTQADKTELSKIIAKAEGASFFNYSAENYQNLQNELAIAKSMYNSDRYLQSEIDNETAKLQKAYNNISGGNTTTPTKPDTPVTPEEPETPAVPDTPTITFKDIPANHWAATYIYHMAELDIINGKSANIFAPEDAITRAEFVAILSRMSGDVLPAASNTFKDVPADAWYAQNVAWAVNAGITKGITTTEFAPNANISRQEMAVMIIRFVEYMNQTLQNNNTAIIFNDDAKIAEYAKEAVAAMQKAGIINGKENNLFAPNDNATRAEAAKMLSILLDQIS